MCGARVHTADIISVEAFKYQGLVKRELGIHAYDPEYVDYAMSVASRIVKDHENNPDGQTATLEHRIRCSLRFVALNVKKRQCARLRAAAGSAKIKPSAEDVQVASSRSADLSLDIKTAFSHLPSEHHKFMEFYKDTGSLNKACAALHIHKRLGAKLLAESCVILKPLLECYS